MFCHVSTEQVVGVHDVNSVYHVPLLLQSQGIVEYLRKRLNLPALKISEEMISKGLSLGAQWKSMIKGYASLPSIFWTMSPPLIITLAMNASLTKSRSSWLGNTLILRTHTCLSSKLSSTLRSALSTSLSFRLVKLLLLFDDVLIREKRSGWSLRTSNPTHRYLIPLNTTTHGVVS